MNPDERTFREHTARGRFRLGVDRGDWRVLHDRWPHPVIAVASADREDSPGEYAFRFDLVGYPAVGPTAEPWDAEADVPLPPPCWPTGGDRVGVVFNPGWMPSSNLRAIYHPMDRLALVGHDNWRTNDPSSIWDPSRMDIVDYLKVLHDLLHSAHYTGLRRAA